MILRSRPSPALSTIPRKKSAKPRTVTKAPETQAAPSPPAVKRRGEERSSGSCHTLPLESSFRTKQTGRTVTTGMKYPVTPIYREDS